MVVGVAGSLPIHGIGTASFLIEDSNGVERILKIHNCLLCQDTTEGESFNLISVSQMLKTALNTVEFNVSQSKITMQTGKKKLMIAFDLQPEDGLYALDMFPLNAADKRHKTLVSIDMTLNEDLNRGTNMGEDRSVTVGPAAKSASRLGSWYSKRLWIGKVFSLAGRAEEFEEGLVDFCHRYVSPLSIPPARNPISSLMWRILPICQLDF
jgi:hypothetical protein